MSSNKSIKFMEPTNNGFSTSKVLYEMPYSKRFPYDFLFITMLLKSKFSETNINFF